MGELEPSRREPYSRGGHPRSCTALVPKTMFEPGCSSAASLLLTNAFVSGGVFVAASYSIGIFAVAICRCIIDPISSLWPRPQLFRLFYPQRFKSYPNAEINRQYREAVSAAVDSESEYKRAEIKNRRERGRLLRSGILPLALFVWFISGGLSVWLRLCIEFLAFVFCVFLYAYVELTIYQESILTK